MSTHQQKEAKARANAIIQRLNPAPYHELIYRGVAACTLRSVVEIMGTKTRGGGFILSGDDMLALADALEN